MLVLLVRTEEDHIGVTTTPPVHAD
jgi:hypothetical protein